MAETDFKYDVFISYSSANKDWVRKDLLSALEKAGLKVCIDFRDFKAGKPAIKNMRDSILESKHTLLVLTEAYLKSGWTEFENLISQTLDPANQKGRVIPMLKEKCNPSLEISYLTYVNFYNPDDWDIAWKQLLEALGSLVTPPPVPVEIRWFYGHRYGDIKAFTGRADELKMLDEWLANDRDNLLVITAFGGFGKSALTWQWFNNKVDREKWHTAIWWSFYEKESGFESFLTEALTHLGIETKERSSRQQVNDLLEAMQSTNILIVLDGFERLLRQYGRMDAALQSDDEELEIDPSQRDCTSMPAETFLRGLSDEKIRSKVLMTTRLFPRVLEGTDGKILKACSEENLKAFSPEDAVLYFHNEGIAATRAEIIEVCSAYGYHPLSLSLLVGLINEDHEHKGDILVAKKLDIFDDIKAKRHHVLQCAYESLSPERRDLLSKISCFRGSMEYATIKKVFDNPDLEKSLIDLRKRGLLQYVEETKRYDMHPIVRRYVYDRITKTDRIDTHERLFNYFASVKPPDQFTNFEDMLPFIEIYYHSAKAERIEEAASIYLKYLRDPIYFQFNSYQLGVELLRILFINGEKRLPPMNRTDIQALILSELGRLYGPLGQPSKSIFMREASIGLDIRRTEIKEMRQLFRQRFGQLLQESLNDMADTTNEKFSVSTDYSNIAGIQLSIGKLKSAEENLRESMRLVEGYNAEHERRSLLGHILSYCGRWSEAEQELATAKAWLEEEEQKFAKSTDISDDDKNANYQLQALNCSYISHHFVLKGLESSNINDLKNAINFALSAKELVYKDTKPTPRDIMYIYWLLGITIHAAGNVAEAENNLDEALKICRSINAIDREADILLHFAYLRFHQRNFSEAKSFAEEALAITQRCGYVLQDADVNLFLANYALRYENDKVKAKRYAEQAKKLATCDGPPYYYKVAYEEAERMLEKLK